MVRCHTFGADMGFEVETKDCTAVTDAELGELESLSVCLLYTSDAADE